MKSNLSLKVLLVDDDEHFLIILAKRIEEVLGYPPRIAHSAEEAINSIHRNVPDILITDTNMGAMSGIDLIRTVRAQYPKIQIFSLFSGLKGSEMTAEDVRALGVTEVLGKTEIKQKLIPKLRALALGTSLYRALGNIFPGHIDLRAVVARRRFA